jgi:hypothetical protein
MFYVLRNRTSYILCKWLRSTVAVLKGSVPENYGDLDLSKDYIVVTLLYIIQRLNLNMELDSKVYTRALLVIQDRRHLFETN